jgi:hypothetical protein
MLVVAELEPDLQVGTYGVDSDDQLDANHLTD